MIWKAILAAGGLALAALFGVRVFAAVQQKQSANTVEVNEVPVAVVPTARRDVVERVQFTGVIRPRNEVNVFTKLPGTVEAVFVKVGDSVSAGQVLARVEHRTVALQGQQAQAQARAARAGLAQARTQLQSARTQYERFRNLRADNAVPQAEFERVEAGYLGALSAVEAAESQLAMVTAATGLADESLKNSRIISPIAGTVTRRDVNVGTLANPAQPLFQVQDVSALKLDGSVTGFDYQRIRVGQQALVSADDIPGRTFPGRVLTVSPTLDPQTRRAAVEIEVENPEQRLLPNMFGQVEIETAKREGVLTIPATAVVALPGAKVVYVARAGKAEEVRPTLGPADGEVVVVEKGLAEGDPVITEGQTTVTDGTAIKVVNTDAVVGKRQ